MISQIPKLQKSNCSVIVDDSPSLRLVAGDILRPEKLVAGRALEWLDAHLSHFNPFNRGLDLDETHQTAIAELALLSYLIRRRQPNSTPCVDRFLDVIEFLYRTPQFHENIYHIKQAFPAHLIIRLALADRNIGDVVPDRVIRWMLERGNALSSERNPYRMLELRYLLELGGWSHNLPSEASLFRRTTLGRCAEILSLMDRDVYSITHTIFYLTDFGRKPCVLFRGQRLRGIITLLETLLGMAIHAQHWDLVSELILSCRCLEMEDGAWIRLGWQALLQVQDASGAIRGFNREQTPRVHGAARDGEYFLSSYHRTLTAVLAGMLGLKIHHAEKET